MLKVVQYTALKALDSIFMVLAPVFRELFYIEACPCGCSGICVIDGMSDEGYRRIFEDNAP